MTKRIGLLGGAFNPPHLGHLKLAELALAHLVLNEVRFIPTAQSTHKPGEGPEGWVRKRLLDAALEDQPAMKADPIELERGGPSFTVDTLAALCSRESDVSWIFLLGSDQAASFDLWRDPERVLSLASLAITPRPGCNRTLPALLNDRVREKWTGGAGEVLWLPSTELFFASSELRSRLSQGEHPEGIPRQVLAVILQENLYR